METLEERQLLSITWNGQGGDNLWSTGANWVGGVAPAANEDLVFSGSTRTATQNDLSYTFHSLAFNAGNFSVAGNAVSLSGNLTTNSGVVGTSIPAGVSFSSSAAVNVGYGSNLVIGGSVVDTAGLTLNVASGSGMTLSGGVSGSGALTFGLGYGSNAAVSGGISGSTR